MTAMKIIFSIYRRLSMLVALALIFGILSPLAAPSVSAAGVRFAVIEEIQGSVYVQKAGGFREYKAFRKMLLNQGDYIRTEADSSVVMKVLDHEDEITIGENSSLSISNLKQSSGKKTIFKLWAGYIWVKVKSLINSSDEFEVETPTAVMGVRGTQFFAGVDPFTGETKVIVGAGVVSAEFKNNHSTGTDTGNPYANNRSSNQVLIWPLYEADIFHQPESGSDSMKSIVAPIDVDAFAGSSSQAIIEAILRNKAELDRENAEFVEKRQQLLNEGKLDDPVMRLLDIIGPADSGKLLALSKNLDTLVGNIVISAINQQRVDAVKIKQLIEEINRTAEKKLDLNNVVPLELSTKQAQLLEELKRIKEEHRIQLEEQQGLKEEQQQQIEELLKKLKQQQDRIAKENEEAIKQTRKKAEEAYLNQLSDNEKQRFEKDKFNREQNNAARPESGSPDTGGNIVGTGAPAVTLLPNSANNAVYQGQTVTARSSQAGKLYMLKSSANPQNESDMNALFASGMGRMVSISSANSAVTLDPAGLPAGKYKLFAVNGAGQLSDPSNEILYYPAAVSGILLKSSDLAPEGAGGPATSIRWTDSTSSGVANYRIIRSITMNGSDDGLTIAENIAPGTESFMDMTPSPGKTYYYHVYAETSDGLAIEPASVSVMTAADQDIHAALAADRDLLNMSLFNHFNINVSLGDVKNCYGAEIHLVFNQGILFSGQSGYMNKLFPETVADGHVLVSLEDVRQISGTDGVNSELIYSIVKIGDTYGDSYNSSSGIFVPIPFDRNLTLDGKIQLSYMKLVDQNGDSIYEFRSDAIHPGPSLEYRYPAY